MATIINLDERRGLPSASSLERYDTCPGAYQLEQGLPDMSSPIAEEGTLLHEVFAGERAIDTLSLDQQDLMERTFAIEEKLVGDVLGTRDAQKYSEQRLWYPLDDSEPIFSGKFDRLYVVEHEDSKRTGLLLDAKFGYIPVADIRRNIQLRAYAMLVWQAYNLDEVYVGVIQPRCGVPHEMCLYTADDLRLAEADILRILQNIKEPDAKRIPGEAACKYCKAKAVCPEAHQKVRSIIPLKTVDMKKKIELLPHAQLSTLLHAAFAADEIVKALKDEAKSRLAENPDCLPGWGMVPNPSTREVLSVVGAYKAITDYLDAEAAMRNDGSEPTKLTATQFMLACSVSVTKLEEVIGNKLNLKGQPLKKKIGEMLGDIIVMKPKAPSLKNLNRPD